MRALRHGAVLILALVIAGAGIAAAQDKAQNKSQEKSQDKLSPPNSHYLSSKGSWGQSFPDQWGLTAYWLRPVAEFGVAAVKRDAQPVTVAVIDTGLDWDHRNIECGQYLVQS